MSLTPGTRLGSYEVVAKLGEGGMGEVYRARDTTFDADPEPVQTRFVLIQNWAALVAPGR